MGERGVQISNDDNVELEKQDPRLEREGCFDTCILGLKLYLQQNEPF